MQEKFELSAIKEIADIVKVPLHGHCIYGYRLKEIQGSYKDTLRFIEYILTENFNSAWDKNLWDDIDCRKILPGLHRFSGPGPFF